MKNKICSVSNNIHSHPSVGMWNIVYIHRDDGDCRCYGNGVDVEDIKDSAGNSLHYYLWRKLDDEFSERE